MYDHSARFLKVILSHLHLSQPSALADNPYLYLDYSAYHKNLTLNLTCGISLLLTYKTTNNQQAVLRMIDNTANSMRQNIGKREGVILLETIGRAKRKDINKYGFFTIITILLNVT